MATNEQHAEPDVSALFYALAQDLKVPLTSIAYKAEVAQFTKSHDFAADIEYTARTMLDVIEAYILSIQSDRQMALGLEPVNPSAVVADVAESLQELAKKFACEVRTDLQHVPHYALTNRRALALALSTVGRVFIEAQDVVDSKNKAIVISSYKTAQGGIRVGVFGEGMHELVTSDLLSRARSYVGTAARPFSALAAGVSSHLFVAERLASAIDAPMHSAKHSNLSGLAFDLTQTAQLSLV